MIGASGKHVIDGRARASVRLVAATALVLTVAPFLLRLPLLPRRGFNPDELEHTHFAWCISQGLLPYRDYFEHHTPWLHFALQPLFQLYDATRVPDDAIALLSAARLGMWLCAGFGLWLTYRLARVSHDRRAACAAAVFLGNSSIFLAKSLEIRPDVPAFALALGGLWLLGHGLRRSLDGPSRGRLLAGGLLLGSAVMFTQKVLFFGPGIAVTLLWYVVDARLGVPRLARLRVLAPAVLGAALPVLATAIYFAVRGALWPFIRLNFLLNASWPGLGPEAFVEEMLRQDPLLAGFGLMGLALAVLSLTRRQAPSPELVLLTLSALSSLAGLLLLPAVTFHYLLFILPFLGLFAGAQFVALHDAFLSLAGRLSGTRLLALATAPALLGGLAPSGLAVLLTTAGAGARKWLLPTAAAGMLWLLALAWRRSRLWLLPSALVLMSVFPCWRLWLTFQRGNWQTVQGIRYVLRNTSPWETCFDGFSGLGVFRPHAFFYPFQQRHMFAIQSETEKRELVEGLVSGRVQPKLVFWDIELPQSLPDAAARFIEAHYVPAGLEPIRVRPFDNGQGWWSDEAPRWFGWAPGRERSPHVLFDDRWRPPERQDGRSVRRTRTGASGLIVPIQRRADLRATFRAKADPAALPFELALTVGRVPCGRLAAVAGWHDYAFTVERRELVPGFNAFELQLTSALPDPARRTELAIESLTLTRLPASKP